MSTVIALTPIPTPTIEYGKLAPLLIVLAAAVISVLVEAFVRREARRPIQLIVVFGALIVAFVSLVGLAGTRVIAAEGSVAIDGPTLFLQGTVLVLALVGALLIAERGVDPAGDSFAQRANQLTPQQWRVLSLMVQGDQNKVIAHKLGVGEATVKAHVTVILRKLGVRSRTQAVIEARGLALPPG